MDIEGKGTLLLLLVWTLVLCQKAASHPTCLELARCHVILQDLYDNATDVASLMYVRSSLLKDKFEELHSQDPSYLIAGITLCHTTSYISITGVKEDLERMQNKDVINGVIRLLYSWKDPLKHLIQEAYRLPKFNRFLTYSGRILSEEHQELQQLTKQIASQFDPDMTHKVDYALWSGLQSLQSSDEEPRMFAFYNTLRCLLNDFQKIYNLLKYLKCQDSSDVIC